MFRASSLPIIRSFLLYIRLPSRFRMEHPDSTWKRSSKKFQIQFLSGILTFDTFDFNHRRSVNLCRYSPI